MMIKEEEGKSINTYLDGVQKDLKALGKKGRWRRLAKDRREWRRLLEEAKARPVLQSLGKRRTHQLFVILL